MAETTYTPEAFGRMRQSLADARRRTARPLAAVSVLFGIGQLIALRWFERNLQPDAVRLVAGGIFLVYIAAVAALLVRMRRAVHAATPHCPRCGAALADLSIRLAMVTGRCDGCGGPMVD